MYSNFGSNIDPFLVHFTIFTITNMYIYQYYKYFKLIFNSINLLFFCIRFLNVLIKVLN